MRVQTRGVKPKETEIELCAILTITKKHYQVCKKPDPSAQEVVSKVQMEENVGP